MWILAAGYLGLNLTANWKLIPMIVFFGVGLFYLRSAFQTVVRHEERLDAGDDDHNR